MDTYPDFAELKKYEEAYTITLHDRDAEVTILAPHGGQIEPNTSEIAEQVAGQEYNCFCFNGNKQGCNRKLHITSHRYDEEHAVALVRKSTAVISIHGCSREVPVILLGGRDMALATLIARELAARAVPCQPAPQKWSGTNPKNICNRGLTGRGVQLEISRGLRDSAESRTVIVAAIRAALLNIQSPKDTRQTTPTSTADHPDREGALEA